MKEGRLRVLVAAAVLHTGASIALLVTDNPRLSAAALIIAVLLLAIVAIGLRPRRGGTR